MYIESGEKRDKSVGVKECVKSVRMVNKDKKKKRGVVSVTLDGGRPWG